MSDELDITANVQRHGWSAISISDVSGYCREQGRRGELQALQVFWPDRAGRFPFDRECDKGVWAAQPRLDQEIWPDVLRERRRELGG